MGEVLISDTLVVQALGRLHYTILMLEAQLEAAKQAKPAEAATDAN